MLLETPKTEWRTKTTIVVDPLDAKNLAALRRLVAAR
jgi:hypothetical protein